MSILTELCPQMLVFVIEAENDEEAIVRAEDECDKVPSQICMVLYREDGSRVKHWGKLHT